MSKSGSKNRLIIIIIVIFLLILLIASCTLIYLYSTGELRSNKVYTAEYFGISTITSELDADGDGIDDYTDILLGARAYIETKPEYKSVYYKDGGYPTNHFGVCTDVIWNALMAAGYTLKDMVDADILNHTSAYPDISAPDPDIDFRRVKNLNVFFSRNTMSLTTDLREISEWQPGDIVVFPGHIAIVSDKRNAKGYPFIIHHGPAGAREKNEIENYEIIGHYRWKLDNLWTEEET